MKQMKKFMIIMAALLVLSMSLYACSDDKDNESTDTTASILGENTESGSNTESENETQQENETTAELDTTPSNEISWNNATGTVYVISFNGAVNLRTDTVTNVNTNIEISLSNGAALERTGVSADGDWTRVNYNNKTCYIKSTYVTEWQTAEDVEVTEVNKTLTLVSTLKVRPRPNTVNEEIGYVGHGAKVEVIGEYGIVRDAEGKATTGWYKIKRENGSAFISAYYDYFEAEAATEEVTTTAEDTTVAAQ